MVQTQTAPPAARSAAAPVPVRLARPLGESLRAGHPWIYREALAALPERPAGTVVDVLDQAGAFVARGLYDPLSPLAVRVFTLDPAEAVDAALLRRRLGEALAARRFAFDPQDTDAYRLCNGEGDRLPGVVVDVYGAVVVARFDGAAAAIFRPHLPEALCDLDLALGRAPESPRRLQTLYERTPGTPGQLLFGSPPDEEIVVREHGVRLRVDVVRGQKTGLFLDQRDNRRLIRGLAAGLRVWNGFCYTGGFSVQAALGGARSVVSVDSAPAALQTARRNFTENGLSPADYEFACADAFVHLRQVAAVGGCYDLVIADPPSFAHAEKSVRRALIGYRDLFVLTMGVVAKGGLLAAGSCTSHVRMEDFLAVLGEAAARCGRPAQVLEVRGQPGDHPSPAVFPEGRYLKFVLLRLLG